MFDNKKEITSVDTANDALIVSIKKERSLGPFKNYKVLGLPETTEQEIYS